MKRKKDRKTFRKIVGLALLLLVFQLLSLNIQVKADATLGKATIGGSTYADYGWYCKYACRFQALDSGKITKLTIYTSANRVQHYAFVYADNNGAPSTLLGSVAWTPPSSAWGWYDINGFDVDIVKGNHYWLGLNVGSGSAAFKYDTGATNQFAVNTDVPPPNNQFGSPRYYAYEISIYATYTSEVAPKCNLESRQNTNENFNLGTIAFDNVEHSLPDTILKNKGSYQVSYNPSLGYQFQMWETSGDVSVENNKANPATVTMSGNGTLRAVYSTLALNASTYKISINPNAHNDYGLGYPVTYIFLIPKDSSNLKAYRRYSLNQSWTQLEEKTADDFFNGIECVRFNYSQNMAYVSVAFSNISDDVYLNITDVQGNVVETAFLQIAKYYDNRKAVVVATGDDLDGSDYVQWAFKLSSDTFQTSRVWVTFGIETDNGYPPNWNDIQEQLDEGFIEIASHSRTHSEMPYANYDSEIGGSKDDIIGNLTLPSLYKKGNDEYVWLWIEPRSQSDATVRQKLGQYKYLVSRTTEYPQNNFATWDSEHGTFNRIGISAVADDRTLGELNTAFNVAYANGQIYHFYFHVGSHSWSPTDKIPQHLEYIRNKTDVWYAGFGALYAYHYVYLNVTITQDIVVAPRAFYNLTINYSENGRTEPTNGTYIYVEGSTVEVLAIPKEKYYFTSWLLNNVTYVQNPISITMDKNYTLTPNFKENLTQPEKLFFSIKSNSTVEDLRFIASNYTLKIKVKGPLGTTGYAKVTIAKSLLSDITLLKVYLNDIEVNYAFTSDNENWFVSIEYTHA